MSKYPVPANEEERIKKLAYFDLLDLAKDPQLDVFAETACLIADCPASLIARMESETQVIQSCIGMSLDFVDRKNTVCQYSIESGDVVVIPDTLLDERSSENCQGKKYYTIKNDSPQTQRHCRHCWYVQPC